jgi:PIN domain
VAALSSTLITNHFDPADRIIAATAIQHKTALVTCDKKLRAFLNFWLFGSYTSRPQFEVFVLFFLSQRSL